MVEDRGNDPRHRACKAQVHPIWVPLFLISILPKATNFSQFLFDNSFASLYLHARLWPGPIIVYNMLIKNSSSIFEKYALYAGLSEVANLNQGI